jgi:hypothetical protein
LHALAGTIRQRQDTTFAAGSAMCASPPRDRYSVVTHARDEPAAAVSPSDGRTGGLIVTSTLGGGLVGGDNIQLGIDVEPGARAVTSQARRRCIDRRWWRAVARRPRWR